MISGLDGWLEELADKKIPVLKKHRDQVLAILQDDKLHSLSDCHPILLSDPLMMANLFRVMNQPRQQQNRLPVTTLSSLLSLYGPSKLVEEIKSLVCIEDLGLSERHLNGIQQCLKQSWYCAWFAMRWTGDRDAREPEEIQVAASMQSLAELMLWCYGGDAMLQINHRAYCECGVYYQEVVNVIGCHKRQIGKALSEQWALPELVTLGFETEFNAYTHATAIGLAAVLARICQHGWYGPDMDFFHEKAMHYFGEDNNKAAIHLHRQLLDLAKEETERGYRAVASMLIFTDAKKYPEKQYCLQTEKKPEPVVSKAIEATNDKAVPEPKKVLDVAAFKQSVEQLKVLAKQRAGFNELLRHTVLTLQKEMGFDRVVFFIQDGAGSQLQNKLNLHSSRCDDSLKKMHIDIATKNLFSQLMSKPQAIYLNKANRDKFWPLVPGEVKTALNSESFCAVSIYSAEKRVGMILADNAGDEISADFFKAFQQLTMLFNKALELLKKNKAG